MAVLTTTIKIAFGFALYWLLEQLSHREDWRLIAAIWLAIVGIASCVISLHSQLAQMPPQLAALRTENVTLQDILRVLQTTITALQDDLAALRLGIVEDGTGIATLRQQVATLRQQVATVQQELADAAEQHRTLNNDLDSTRLRLEDHRINTLAVTHRPDANLPLACNDAARLGDSELLRRLQKQGYPQNESTVEAAICAGHVKIVADLLDPNFGSGPCPVGPHAIQLAVRHPWPLCKQFLELLLRQGHSATPLPMTLTADIAASPHPPRQMLEWFMNPENGSTNFEWHPDTVTIVLATHGVDEVSWIAQRCPHLPLIQPFHMMVAAARGNIPLMEWLRRADTGDGVCDWDASVFRGAANDTTRAWLIANGCPRE